MKQAGIYVNDVFCGILTEDDIADEDIPSQWEELISQSFLPEKKKVDYCTLLDKRNSALDITK